MKRREPDNPEEPPKWVRREDLLRQTVTLALQCDCLDDDSFARVRRDTPVEKARIEILGDLMLTVLVLFPQSDLSYRLRERLDDYVTDPDKRALFNLPPPRSGRR